MPKIVINNFTADDDPELVTVSKASPGTGFKIRPPSDPKERERWERGVKEREAKGLGKYVGDQPSADSPAIEAMRKEMWGLIDKGKYAEAERLQAKIEVMQREEEKRFLESVEKIGRR